MSQVKRKAWAKSKILVLLVSFNPQKFQSKVYWNILLWIHQNSQMIAQTEHFNKEFDLIKHDSAKCQVHIVHYKKSHTCFFHLCFIASFILNRKKVAYKLQSQCINFQIALNDNLRFKLNAIATLTLQPVTGRCWPKSTRSKRTTLKTIECYKYDRPTNMASLFVLF